MKSSLRSTIEVARPDFWSTQLWFFLLPLGGQQLFGQPGFWLGVLYATFPLRHLLYGWNDLADHQTEWLSQ